MTMSDGLVDRHIASPDAARLGRGFAAVLRERTSGVHREAERSGFIADLIRGRTCRDAYVVYLRNLLPVYEALEGALAARAGRDHADVFAPFIDDRVRRVATLRADLLAIAGRDWRSMGEVLSEARSYAHDIAAVAGDVRLVAHAYARYLGDLSGGQILKPLLARTLELPADALAFYDFPAIPSLEGHKVAMRDALDGLDPDSAMTEVIVAEATASFRHNIALSKAVQAATGGSGLGPH